MAPSQAAGPGQSPRGGAALLPRRAGAVRGQRPGSDLARLGLLAGIPDTAIVEADLRDPAGILSRPQTRDLLDLTQPIGVLLAAVLHFTESGEDAFKIISMLRDAVAAGSYLVMTNATAGDTDRRRCERRCGCTPGRADP